MAVQLLFSLFGSGPWVTSGAVFCSVFVAVRSYLDFQATLPPGPIHLPIVGCLLQVAGRDLLQLFSEYRSIYGDVFSFYMGSRLVVVVNGASKLKEVFITNSDVFSNRPHVFSVDTVGQGKAVVNGSGEVWQEHRKFSFKCFRKFAIGNSNLETKIQEEVVPFFQVLDKLEGKSVDPNQHMQTAIANIICSIVFGKRFQYDDPKFKEFLKIFEENMQLVGGMSLLNFFPFLEKVPGDFFKVRQILRNVARVQSFLSNIIGQERASMDHGNPRHFVDAYLDEMAEKKSTSTATTMADDQLLKLVGDMFVGGTETTSTTLRWAFIFLVHHRDIQQKVRDEIDAKCGGATVTMKDQPSMPYTWATVLEAQRMADIAPLAVAHGLAKDARIGDYFIPQDALVLPNIHSVHFDPLIFGDPHKFNPERFIRNGEVKVPHEFMPFSLGPRECLGKNIAKMELFIFLASMIKRYTILPAENGVLPKLEGVLGVTRTPLPYKIRFVKRD